MLKKILLLALLIVGLSACSINEHIEKLGQTNSEKIILDKYKDVDKDIAESTYINDTIYLASETFSSLNPYTNKFKGANNILMLAYDSLIRIGYDNKFEEVLVKNFKFSSDGKSCSFDLRDIDFHDGSKLTYDDILYSYQVAKNDIYYGKKVNGIGAIQRTSSGKINISFKKASYLNHYSLLFPIVKNNSAQDKIRINGTGSYSLLAYYPMQKLILQSENNKIEVELMRNKRDIENAFIKNKSNIYADYNINWEHFSQEKIEATKNFLGNKFIYIGINHDNSFLSDEKIRKLLFYELNHDKIYNKVFYGHIKYKVLPCIIGQDLDEKMAKEELSPLEMELLQDYYVKNYTRPKLRLIYLDSSLASKNLANMLEDFWGHKLDLVLIPLNEGDYLKALANGTFELYIAESRIDIVPDLRSFLHTQGSLNYMDRSSLMPDILVENFENAGTYDQAMAAYQELLKYQTDHIIYFPIGIGESAAMLNKKYEGEYNPSIYNFYYGIENLKIK